MLYLNHNPDKIEAWQIDLTNKRKGLDNLPPIPFKKTCLSIPHSLCQSYRSLSLCSKKNKSQVVNYKTVSLLNSPGKIFEPLIFKELCLFCSRFLQDSQFGFQKNRSTVTQLITFLQETYKSIATSSDIVVIFIDFSKTFDKVDQRLLLQKFYNMGKRGKLFQVIKYFVVASRQQIRVRDFPTFSHDQWSATRQHSTTLLFLIFVKDLADLCNEVFPLLFADDAKILCVGLDTKAIQDDLNIIFNWTLSNKMLFNIEKWAHIAIPNKNKELLFWKTLIEPAFNWTDLCLHFSGDLNWSLHIDKVFGEANIVFQMIKRNVSLVSSIFQDKETLVKKEIIGSSVENQKIEVASFDWVAFWVFIDLERPGRETASGTFPKTTGNRSRVHSVSDE